MQLDELINYFKKLSKSKTRPQKVKSIEMITAELLDELEYKEVKKFVLFVIDYSLKRKLRDIF